MIKCYTTRHFTLMQDIFLLVNLSCGRTNHKKTWDTLHLLFTTIWNVGKNKYFQSLSYCLICHTFYCNVSSKVQSGTHKNSAMSLFNKLSSFTFESDSWKKEKLFTVPWASSAKISCNATALYIHPLHWLRTSTPNGSVTNTAYLPFPTEKQDQQQDE